MRIRMICIFLFLSILFVGCTTNYYLCTVDAPTTYYSDPTSASGKFTIRPGRQVIAYKQDKNSEYRRIIFGENRGYIKAKTFGQEKKYPSRKLKSLLFQPDSTYWYVGNLKVKPSPALITTPSSSSSSSGGTVHVKGYYRKNGTYVRPHTRSAPKRKG